MNLDDLMEVWRSQDAAPLHGVNETLLRLALREDEAKLKKERRIERRVPDVASAGMIAGLAVFLAIMISTRERNGMTGWDFALPSLGIAAALLAGGAVLLNQKRQTRHEQHFGESLRDQLQRRIAQLDDAATKARLTTGLVLVLMGGVCPTAILLLGYRINQKRFSDDGYIIVTMIFVCVWSVASGVWELRRSMQREILPRKRRLEGLVAELGHAAAEREVRR